MIRLFEAMAESISQTRECIAAKFLKEKYPWKFDAKNWFKNKRRRRELRNMRKL